MSVPEEIKAPETSTTQTSPSAPAAKPTVPSPAAVAKKSTTSAVAHVPTYSDADVEAAMKFGRCDDDKKIYVKDGDSEREVGQFVDGTAQDALKLYARRYLDMKAKIELFAQRLNSKSIKTREIDSSLESLTKETESPAVIGDIPALRERMTELSAKAAAKKEEIAAARKAAVEKAIADRTALVEKAEATIAGLGTSTNWKNTAEEFRQMFDDWQKLQRTEARIDKKTADALWKRFSSARSEFNHRRRAWVKARDAAREQARVKKEQIIAEAEQLKDSTQWGETSRAFNDLMTQWKAAGRAGRKEDDELWTRFRAAADVFFNARQEDRAARDSEAQGNLAKKRELLEKAEKLVPVNTEAEARAARTALSHIQDEWDEIGRVPRENVREIEDRLSAVERQITAVEEAAWTKKDPEKNARKNAFETQITVRIEELNHLLDSSETSEAEKKKLREELEAKKQWLAAVEGSTK